MLDTICFFCKNKFTINHSDSQYYKIKKGENKYYICKSCNNSFQQEAINKTGISPDQIDDYDKFFRYE